MSNENCIRNTYISIKSVEIRFENLSKMMHYPKEDNCGEYRCFCSASVGVKAIKNKPM